MSSLYTKLRDLEAGKLPGWIRYLEPVVVSELDPELQTTFNAMSFFPFTFHEPLPMSGLITAYLRDGDGVIWGTSVKGSSPYTDDIKFWQPETPVGPVITYEIIYK